MENDFIESFPQVLRYCVPPSLYAKTLKHSLQTPKSKNFFQKPGFPAPHNSKLPHLENLSASHTEYRMDKNPKIITQRNNWKIFR